MEVITAKKLKAIAYEKRKRKLLIDCGFEAELALYG